MKTRFILGLALISLLVLSGCGYKLGGVKPVGLQNVQTVTVDLFDNLTVEPYAGPLVTNALAEAIEKDGTYKLASRSKVDARVTGQVVSISYTSLRSSESDSYKSTEIGLSITVSYSVIDAKTNKIISGGSTSAVSSLFSVGNVQTARTNALSFAARMVARQICDSMSNG